MPWWFIFNPIPWCRCLGFNGLKLMPWYQCLDADELMVISWCNALMSMPILWYRCLVFDTLILMPLWGRYVMNLCWWPELVCMVICKTIIRFDFFPQKVSSWKVSVPEKKKKSEALSLQPPFPVIPHYTLSNKHLAKKYPRLHVFFSWQPAVWMNSEELNNPCKSVPMNKWLFHPVSWVL